MAEGHTAQQAADIQVAATKDDRDARDIERCRSSACQINEQNLFDMKTRRSLTETSLVVWGTSLHTSGRTQFNSCSETTLSRTETPILGSDNSTTCQGRSHFHWSKVAENGISECFGNHPTRMLESLRHA